MTATETVTIYAEHCVQAGEIVTADLLAEWPESDDYCTADAPPAEYLKPRWSFHFQRWFDDAN